MSSTPLLECRDIAFERDDYPLFSDVCLALPEGRALQVKGANGVGKTTLLRILATSLAPSCGALSWKGAPLSTQLPDYRANLLYLGHQPAVKLDLTPAENLRWFFHLYPANDVSLEEALERVGLAYYRDTPCHTLSAGQLRRVALARLQVSAAPLWILDEPFTAIDVSGVADLEEVMHRHLAGGGSMVMTSHQHLGIDGLDSFDLEAYVH